MTTKKQNVMNLMAQIQNLSAEEQAMFTNMASRLASNATDEQRYTNVTRAMQAAGWNPLKRAYAGVKTATLNRMESTKGINSRLSARTARLFGMTGTAEFIDRWLTSPKAKKLKQIKEKEEKTEKTSNVRAGTSGIGSGSIAGIKKQLAYVSITVDNISEDVRDIKSLIMPKKLLLKGGTYTDEWGRINSKQEGRNQFAHYNPLAPVGGEFVKSKEKRPKGWRKGLYVHGDPTSTPIDKGFYADALKKASMATAILALKIQKKDAARAELRKKYQYTDKAESYENESPLEKINRRLANIEKILGDGTKKQKGSWFDTLALILGGLWLKFKGMLKPVWTMLSSMWKFIKPVMLGVRSLLSGAWGVIKALGRGVAQLIGKWFPGLTIPGLVAGGAAAGIVAGGAYALDKSMKRTADKNIDKITSDVTVKQANAGFKPEESYQAYKKAIDYALASSENKSQERQDYIKQQLTSSEGLSDLERRMAARYFYEKEGPTHATNGPKTRGTPRSTAVPSEQLDSDTVDTNYSPPSSPKPSGALKKLNYEERLRALGDVIASGESGGDYNIYNKGTIGKNKGKIGHEDLSKMTVGQYLYRGTLGKDDPQKMFAVGKYQIVPKTMRRIVDALGLPLNTTYLTPETQDKMFRYLVESKAEVKRYLEGRSNDKNAALLALSKEWASIGVPEDTYRNGQLIKAGESYYSGEGGNKAFTSSDEILSAITPVPNIGGGTVDQQSRTLQASNSPLSAVTVLNKPTTVNNTNISQTGPKRKVDRADVLSQDNALVRTVMKDTKHPVYVG